MKLDQLQEKYGVKVIISYPKDPQFPDKLPPTDIGYLTEDGYNNINKPFDEDGISGAVTSEKTDAKTFDNLSECTKVAKFFSQKCKATTQKMDKTEWHVSVMVRPVRLR